MIRYETIPLVRLDEIQGLWEKLNSMHEADSIHFKEHYHRQTFAHRCRKFHMIDEQDIHILMIFDDKRPVGYCISTITDGCGEIDSLYVLDTHRSLGYGKELMERSLSWLKQRGCEKISVSVADGHHEVFGFYEQFGFYPRLTYLELK